MSTTKFRTINIYWWLQGRPKTSLSFSQEHDGKLKQRKEQECSTGDEVKQECSTGDEVQQECSTGDEVQQECSTGDEVQQEL